MTEATVLGVGVLTGWGEGVAALPDDAARAAAGRDVIPIATPTLTGEGGATVSDRFRRATRECLLGVAAAGAALRDAGLAREDVTGADTALLYVTAGAYGASNRAFIEAASTGALHFPYTAPSAVPAEVAIELGLRGAYVILIGGATATLEALWHASTLIARDTARYALVLAVEAFSECADLYARGRRLLGRPMVESAACAVLGAGAHGPAWRDPGSDELERRVRLRAGETLACAPLIAAALARADQRAQFTVSGYWRGRRAALEITDRGRAGSESMNR
jgi:3-oxoacyl-(acyl-carrier-protein) synthase